jgi:hypothetical protein
MQTPLLIRYAIDAAGRQLALISVDLSENKGRNELTDVSILIEANLLAVTYSFGLSPPQRALSTVLPRRLRSAFSLLSTFRAGLLSATQDVLNAAKRESQSEAALEYDSIDQLMVSDSEQAGTFSSSLSLSFFRGKGNFSPCSLEEVLSSALLPLPSSTSSLSSFSRDNTVTNNNNKSTLHPEDKILVSGEPLNWSDDAEMIVSTWARAAALGADPLIPGLRGRALDKSRFFELQSTSSSNQSIAQKSISPSSITSKLSSSSSSFVGEGDLSEIAMNSSRPSTFHSILYWTPQSFTILTGKDSGDVACYGIASNVRVERIARPPNTEKGLFIDAYRFRCDAQGYFSFQCDKNINTKKSSEDNSNNSNKEGLENNKDDKKSTSRVESLALGMLLHSGHIDTAETAARALSKSSSLDAGLVADGRVFGVHSKDVQSVNAGGSLFLAANVSAHLSKNGKSSRDVAIRTIESRKWQCESAQALGELSSLSSSRPQLLLFNSTALADSANMSTSSDREVSICGNKENSNVDNNYFSSAKVQAKQQEQHHRQQQQERLFNNKVAAANEDDEVEGRFFLFSSNESTPSRHDSAPSPIAERSGSIVDVSCADEIVDKEDRIDNSSTLSPPLLQQHPTESIYHLQSDALRRHPSFNSSLNASSSSSFSFHDNDNPSTSSILKRFPGVSLTTLKAAGIIEDDYQAQARMRNEQRERLVAMSLLRSRACLEITKGP